MYWVKVPGPAPTSSTRAPGLRYSSRNQRCISSETRPATSWRRRSHSPSNESKTPRTRATESSVAEGITHHLVSATGLHGRQSCTDQYAWLGQGRNRIFAADYVDLRNGAVRAPK